MIKKSLGIALLSVTVLTMAACSSSDDDATDTTTGTGTATEGTTTEGEGTTTEGEGTTTEGEGTTTEGEGTTTEGEGTTTEGEGTTTGGDAGYRAGSVMGVMAANADLSLVAGALKPSFDQNFDTANQNWTMFAPTNEAVQAAIAGGATVNDDVLKSHIFTGGTLNAADLNVGDTLSMADNSMFVITAGATGGLQINGVDIISADVGGDNGALHILDGVLLSNAP